MSGVKERLLETVEKMESTKELSASDFIQGVLERMQRAGTDHMEFGVVRGSYALRFGIVLLEVEEIENPEQYLTQVREAAQRHSAEANDKTPGLTD